MYLFPSRQITKTSTASIPILRRIGVLVTTAVYLAQGLFSYMQYTYGTPKLTPVIKIEDGALQGRLAYSRNGQEYWQFLGIPFAEPPVGSLRFQPPIPVRPWGVENVKQVLKFPPACVQFDPIFVVRTVGKEDCLFLNVFTTNSVVKAAYKGRKGAPVLVYIHGGAFLEGESSLYHPTFLMDHSPLVVVTLQYRLGPLGFLNFQEKDPNYPRGNQGLKDQALALEWVQKNIAAFGGNPQMVTIMGESAGSASVNLHMTSPLSRGLFHRAVGISGSALCPWAFTNRSRDIAEKYGKRFGCQLGFPRENYTSADELLECFQSMRASDLVKMQWSWGNPSVEKDEFVPSVEPIQTNDTFLFEPPNKIIQEGRSAPVPFLTGITSGEGSLRSARLEAIPELVGKLRSDWDTIIGRLMFFDEDPVRPEISRKVRDYYFKQGLPQNDQPALLKSMTWLTGDALFNEPVRTSALEHAKRENPTYLFYYDYKSNLFPGMYTFFRATKPSDGTLSVVKFIQVLIRDWVREKLLGMEDKQRDIYGVGHAENAIQIWDILGVTGPVVNGDRKFSEELVKTFMNFVQGGEPSFRGLKWPNINSSDMSIIPYMLMDSTGQGKVISEPIADRMQFWEGLAKYREERR